MSGLVQTKVYDKHKMFAQNDGGKRACLTPSLFRTGALKIIMFNNSILSLCTKNDAPQQNEHIDIDIDKCSIPAADNAFL